MKQELPLLAPNVVWQNKSFRASANNPALGSSGVCELSCAGGNITVLISGFLCQVVCMWRWGWFFCLLCILLSIHSLLLSLPMPVLLLLWLFFFFTFCQCIPPPPHILIFFVWHLALSCCFSLFLPLSFALSPLLLVSLWCPYGWLNDWSHKAVPPTLTYYAELSCAVLLIFLPSLHEKRKQCDSDAKVGGIGPGGWLNRLTEASPAHSLLHRRCSDKLLKQGKLEMWTAFKCDLQFKECCRYISGLFWSQTKAFDLIYWDDCYVLW